MLASEAMRHRCVDRFISMHKAESHSLHSLCLEHVRSLTIVELSYCCDRFATSVGVLQGVVIASRMAVLPII